MDPAYEPLIANPPIEEADVDWNLIKDVSIHGVVEPIVAGTFFAFVWLGTFYFLKKKLNV